MSGFITVMLLICQPNIIPGHKGLYCFDKGTINVRGSTVKEAKPFQYYKCADRLYKDCSINIEWDGCVYIINDKEKFYSSNTCP